MLCDNVLTAYSSPHRLCLDVTLTVIAASDYDCGSDCNYDYIRWLWPEGAVLFFNTALNQSSQWGVEPWHWYFSRAIPKVSAQRTRVKRHLPYPTVGDARNSPSGIPTHRRSATTCGDQSIAQRAWSSGSRVALLPPSFTVVRMSVQPSAS